LRLPDRRSCRPIRRRIRHRIPHRIRLPILATLFFGLASLPIRARETGEGIPDPESPGTVEGWLHSYQDDNRLAVSSMAGGLEHPLSPSLRVRLRAVADWISIAAAPAGAEASPPHTGHETGHEHIEEDDNPALDAVSGASARIGTGAADSRELRAEGSLGLAWSGRLGNRPVTLSAEARGSREPDYLSMSGTLAGRVELFQANTVVTAFMGAGRDAIDPDPAPAGQTDLWPADQLKLSGGASVSQILTRRLIVAGGASAAVQAGTLSSPYRNSLVGITYFPERLPRGRIRGTGFLAASGYLGFGAALHLRQGMYADDWGVTAWIPEAALAKEFGALMLTLKHRFYAQTRADFSRTAYPDRSGFQTGDPRLGRLYDQTGRLEAEYRFRRSAPGAGPLVLSGGYGMSRLEYPDLHPRALVSHVFSLGARSEY
jgi:hypothetical protein